MCEPHVPKYMLDRDVTRQWCARLASLVARGLAVVLVVNHDFCRASDRTTSLYVLSGVLNKVFANTADEDTIFTDGHLVAEDRLLLLSDSVGDITALDLRTNSQARRQDADEGYFLHFEIIGVVHAMASAGVSAAVQNAVLR